MFCYICEFIVVPEHLAAFVRDYGSGGPWVDLFARDEAYQGTELRRDTSNPHRFLTIDHWESEDACMAFRSAHRRELNALDAACARYKQREVYVGDFELVE